MSTSDVKARFLSNLVKEDGPIPGSPCIVWTAYTDLKGYGHCWYEERWQHAHRVAWQLFVGPIGENSFICHHCDNPSCVRISHLYEGDEQTNSDDMYERGRDNHAVGERSGNSKLNADKVRQILSMLKNGRSRFRIAKQFGVSISVINGIALGKTWLSVEGERPPLIKREKQSRFYGVSGYRHRWRAYVNAFGKQRYLGLFDTEAQAALSVNAFICDQWLDKPLNVIPGIHD